MARLKPNGDHPGHDQFRECLVVLRALVEMYADADGPLACALQAAERRLSAADAPTAIAADLVAEAPFLQAQLRRMGWHPAPDGSWRRETRRSGADPP